MSDHSYERTIQKKIRVKTQKLKITKLDINMKLKHELLLFRTLGTCWKHQIERRINRNEIPNFEYKP